MQESNGIFIGIDASTQSISAVAIDLERGEIVWNASLNFESDFPKYCTSSGVVYGQNNPLEVFSYPEMWLDGLDAVLGLASKNLDIKHVKGIAVSAQQHASVWLSSSECFSKLDSSGSLAENIAPCLSRRESPVWLDASTSTECAEISNEIGGAERVLSLTGSVETERFTGAQIRKIFKWSPRVYENTSRIHLASSFLTSVLSGSDAPADYGDGAGMNLMNIDSLDWDKNMLSATADRLLPKLPRLSPSDVKVGDIAKYFVEKYGFSSAVQIAAGSGDNPSSLVGLGAMLYGCAAISLGTSDTYFASLSSPLPASNAHIFGNPAGGYMNLLCFRNGSLARENLKNSLGTNWRFFDVDAFENYFPSADAPFVFPFLTNEISPKLKSDGIMAFGRDFSKLGKAEAIRGLVEGQFLNMLSQTKKMSRQTPSDIILTGGASKSDGIAQTIADIFDARVSRLKRSDNSAALGAAMRAAKIAGPYKWEELAEKFCSTTEAKKPRAEAHKIHTARLPKFERALAETFGL